MCVKEKEGGLCRKLSPYNETQVVIIHQGFLNLGKISPNNVSSYFPLRI